MLKNYLKIALRNLRRHSAYSILNISGMAIGMACAILILLWVQDEWSYDRHYEHADDMYRIIERDPIGGGSMMVPTPAALANTLKEEYPEIIRTTRYTPSPLTLKKGEEFVEELVAIVDKDFLKMFDIEFVEGDINTALDEQHNIIITEEMARKYFGNADALGKTIPSRGYDVKVTGVVKSLPHNSHIQFNFLVSLDWLTELGAHINDWGERFHTYIELRPGTDYRIVDQKIQGLLKRHIQGSQSELFLQNIQKIHLYSARKFTYDLTGHGDIAYVRIMALVALFILLIACINFMSLSTAQSARRTREIGVRKVAGANKGRIVFQFLGESLLIVFVAHAIAMILVELLLPGFNNLTDKQLSVNYQSPVLYAGLFAVVLFCGLLAGSYPALYLSSLNSVDTLKGIINKNPGNARFRRVLVIFQFSLSVALIICTLIIGNQFHYMQNKNLGYNKDNMGYFMFPIRPGDPVLESLKKALLSNPDIVHVTMGDNPVNVQGNSTGFKWTGKKEGNDVIFYLLGTEPDYAKTFQLKLKEGRFFSSEFPSDGSSVVINEKAAAVMGLKEPVGETLTTPWGSKATILGVVHDFHFKSLHYKIEPLIMLMGPSNNFYVRMKPGNMISTVKNIDKAFQSFNPGLPMEFHFLDDDFDKLYRTEQRMNRIFSYFSILAIIISCLGLLGLSSFMTARRTKEIGIRKVNGAKSAEIFTLLSGEYMTWVSIAILIACPVAWYVMHKWLQNYAYHVNMGLGVFILAGILALLITLLTVSIQSYRAAGKNPVDGLRYE